MARETMKEQRDRYQRAAIELAKVCDELKNALYDERNVAAVLIRGKEIVVENLRLRRVLKEVLDTFKMDFKTDMLRSAVKADVFTMWRVKAEPHRVELQRVHAEDCAVALNPRHACSCRRSSNAAGEVRRNAVTSTGLLDVSGSKQ